MNAPRLQPIPTPAVQRLRHFKTTVLPGLIFCSALAILGCLWRDRMAAPTMVGQADGALANVSSHQAGVLAGLRVARFQKVRAGEPLANVLIADPKLVEASLAVIRAELDLLRANLDPIVSQQRNAVDYAKLRLDWMRQRTELARARVNLQFAESEWHRAEELFQTKIASESELERTRSTYQALQKQVEELNRLVLEGEASFNNLQPSNSANGIARVTDEPMQAAIAAQEARLRLTEAQLSPLLLRAPIDGTVTAIHFRSGESVTPGQPILTIAADEPTRIVGYLRQPGGVAPKSGASVMIRTRSGQRLTGTAQILEVGAQLDVLPPALQSMKLAGAELALPVNISLPSALDLRPGELVDISLIPSTQ
ncbi:MAG: HlyD family efflux transporter periplasmic adaptor subunit [Verrucomicrobiota bacterium]